MASAGTWPRRSIGLIVKAAVVIALAVAIAWFAARPSKPDAFYSHSLPADAVPGTLLKSEGFSKGVPEGAEGWRILYNTMRGGKSALASAVVVVLRSAPGSGRRIIAWAHGTTGIVAGCAPSILAKPFDNVPDMAAIVREG